MTLILLLLLLSWLLLSLLLFLLLQLPVPLFLCLSDGAFLTVSIASPEYEDTGFYKCRFAYLNMAEFKFTLLNKTFEVTFTGRLGTLRQRITLSNLVMLHYTTPHYTTLHCTTLHYTALHYTTLHYNTSSSASSCSCSSPKGRPGMSDVTLLSGISGLSFDSPFLSPVWFLLPSPLALSVLSFFC